MSSFQIAVIVGNLRKDSFNRKLALALAKLAPAGCTLKHARIDDLPFYNQDDDTNQSTAVKPAGVIGDGGQISIDSTRTFLQGWTDKYSAWVKAYNA